MKVVDLQCQAPKCKHVFEEWVNGENDFPIACTVCGCLDTKVVFMHPPQTLRRKQPYDYLRHSDDPPIRSVVPKSFKSSKKKAGT